MHHSVTNLLRAPLVPEITSDVSAGASRDIHFVLVTITTVRTFPYKSMCCFILHDLDLAVIAADLTVIGFGVQLSIHDIVIDELHYTENCRNVVLHVRHFHIADGTAWG